MMDDSDQDFVDLCSNFKLLKRVRRKPNDTTAAPRNTHPQPFTSAQPRDTNKRKRNKKKDVESSTGSAVSSKAFSNDECAAKQPGVNGSVTVGHVCGGMGPPLPAGSGAESKVDITEKGAGAKEKVLFRMQQFKRVSPQKMMHNEKNPSRRTEHDDTPQSVQKDIPGPSSCGLQDSDEALALRLQQELDREAADAQAVDLEDRGLFFCQLCNKDLSHMTTEGRTQHLNRCLDVSEDSAPAPPPPPSVPNCPICGKAFKSHKSRSVHLKRCSSDMGVSPAVLLQVLQRQATEAHSGVSNQAGQTGSSKRKGSSEPDLPAKKQRKPKKKAQLMDEDTMVALALSSSLMERMKEEQRLREMEREIQRQTTAPHTSIPPPLRWRPDAGKGRGKRKKVPRPPPLLLVQDAETALRRLQERVAVLLLCGRAPSPPTPIRCPSSLSAQSSTAPLWHKSQLRDGGPRSLSEFYTPELGEFIMPWKSAETEMISNKDNPESCLCPPAREGTPLTMAESSTLPSSSQTVTTPAPCTPGTGHLPVGSQVIRDLIDLADEGMTLSQWGYAPTRPAKDLQVSGFVPEEPTEQADLHLSGFLPEKTPTHSQAPRRASQRGVPTAKCTHKSEPLSRLASDLNCMVNNPQLSDVQIQVDSGEIYFAHSFMLYARCPLLVQMVHDSGFGVKEEDMPTAQRVLLGDVPGQAIYLLLQYIYTAHCRVTASLLPHVLELASRFDLDDLRQLCELYSNQTDDGEGAGEGQSWEDGPGQEHQSGVAEDAFLELLRSMWTEEDEDNDGTGENGERDGDTELDEVRHAGRITSGDGEMPDEHVNEEEIEEIYEFAATQRKREEERREGDLDSETERDDEIMMPEPQRGSMGSAEKSHHGSPQCILNASLDRSYNRLFSESWGAYVEDSSSQQPEKRNAASQKQQHCPSPRKLAPTTNGPEKRTERPCLQSSVSAIELVDISMSPPSIVANLPVPGLSPAAVSGAEALGRADVDMFNVPKAFFNDQVHPREGGVSPKQESQGRLTIHLCNALASRPNSKEPELVVLSDSEEEMETGPAAVCSPSPSPSPPHPSQQGHSYTQIKTLPKVKHKTSGVENSQESCNVSPIDCSPEVSWLIPATPDAHSRTTSSSSTQTHSSMRRSQLFPKSISSSLSSSQSASSSRSLSLKNRPCTSVSPLRPRGSEHITRADGGVDPSSHSPVCTVPPSPAFRPSSFSRSQPLPLQQGDSIQGTPLHKHCPPYSSTPLNMDIPHPPTPSVASPLLSDHNRETSTRRGSVLSQNPEKRALETLHLSLSENPVSQTSSLHRCPPSPPGDSVSSSHTRCSSQSDYHEGSKAAEITGEKPERSEEGERVSEVEEKGTDTEGLSNSAMIVKEETEEADISKSSFQQSFMDMEDPPMVFDDSWGLNAGADGDDVPDARFSLRLEDSGGAGQLQHSVGGGEMIESSTPTAIRSPRLQTRSPTHASPSFTHSPPPHFSPITAKVNASLLDSKIWDSWEEEEEDEEALPLSQRLNPVSPFKTPVTSRSRKRPSLVPITPMPSYSDMDTPDLKNKLNRFGVRPLPKRQMVLKLKEIHQYTHQIAGSESEDEAPSRSVPTTSSAALSTRPACAKAVTFKQPSTDSHDVNHHSEEDAEPLSASQGSNTSSTAASEDSERSNPELCLSSDGDSDSDVTASQASSRLQDRLQAVRSFILSDPALYSQILQYQPLVLSHLQARLKAAGIRLGAAKLLDYLDSQCITSTTAKPGRSAPTRKRARGQGARGAARGGARGRKRGAATAVA